jgi:hypothetical protein
MTSTATTIPTAYYQSFDSSQSRAVATDIRPLQKPIVTENGDEKALTIAQQQTYDLQYLAVGWNGYDALPPSATSVDHAMRWLVSSYAECKDAGIVWHKPNVTASAESEVVFEWWAEDRSLIVYIEEETASFQQSHTYAGQTEHTHGEADLGTSQAELLRWFGE